jgi:hypothetical protein
MSVWKNQSFSPRHYIGVNSQRHAPAPLAPDEDFWYPLGKRLARPQMSKIHFLKSQKRKQQGAELSGNARENPDYHSLFLSSMNFC